MVANIRVTYLFAPGMLSSKMSSKLIQPAKDLLADRALGRNFLVLPTRFAETCVQRTRAAVGLRICRNAFFIHTMLVLLVDVCLLMHS